MKKFPVLQFALGLLLVALLGGGLVVGVSVVRAYKTPLSPAMVVESSNIEGMAKTTDEVAKAVFAQDSTGACGQSGSMELVLIGRDEDLLEPNGADAIRYVKADFDNKKVTVFTFHRDLWLDTPALVSSYGISAASIGPVYDTILDKKGAAQEGNSAAAGAVASILSNTFGLKADYYVSVDEKTFAKFVDTVGGVEVEVTAAVTLDNVTTGDPINLQAGKQVMDGRTAEAFVRYKGADGEWGRIERQNLVLVGFLKKLASAEGLSSVPELASQFLSSTFTDLSPEQIVSLACLANEASQTSDGISMQTFDKSELKTEGPFKISLTNLALTRTRVQELFK